MKPQDLRQGNYVLRPTDIDTQPTEYIVDKIFHFRRDSAYFKISDNETIGMFLWWLRPIPITKELLESVGFEYLKGARKWCLRTTSHEFYAKTNSTDNQYWLCTDLYFDQEYRNNVYKLNGFHHLQNIIHDLTGKELSLKEKTNENNT